MPSHTVERQKSLSLEVSMGSLPRDCSWEKIVNFFIHIK